MIKKYVLMVHGILQCLTTVVLLLLVATPAAYAATWDLVTDFNAANTAGSAWTLGYETSLGGTFTQYDTKIYGAGGPKWLYSTYHSSDNNPSVWMNTTAGTLSGVDPGEVSLHPGSGGSWPSGTDGAFSVVRWTASETGYITVTFRFDEGDSYYHLPSGPLSGSMSYYVIDKNGVKYQWINDPNSESGTFTTTVAMGDTIDFIVGPNGTADGGWGNTPLAVTITGASVYAVYANFTGNGLYKWNGTAWSKINTVVAANITASSTDLYATFTGYTAFYKWNGTAWSKITTVTPAGMTASATDLYATFTGYGTYKYSGTTWTRINTVAASGMTASSTDLYATFTGYAGLYKWNGSAWSKINTVTPVNMAASSTDLYASFAGYGTYKYSGTAWSKINTITAVSMTASSSDLYATFTGYTGLYKWNGTAWSKINTVTPANMAASISDLYATFTGYTGLYKWNGTAWSKINTVTPVSMTGAR